MQNHLKEYFSFTKKERTGIIVLLVLILATTLIPYFIPTPVVKPDRAAFERLREQLAQLEKARDPGSGESYRPDHYEPVEPIPDESVVLFEFDPNTLPAEGWKKLGIQERTTNTIQHYLAKGGRFRRPEDLYKIYGLKREDGDRLLPYVRIQITEPAREAGGASGVRDSAAWKNNKPGIVKPVIIDINTADTSAFIALRGIGSKLAWRIIHFREKLGGFYSVEQIGETYGLPDSTFRQVKAFLQCTSPVLRAININTADINTFQQHPYIRRQLANAIVQYREQHGAYESIEQLLQINILATETLEKVRPYLVIE
jgi:competence protein ComEA